MIRPHHAALAAQLDLRSLTVLDVGCRDGAFRAACPAEILYCGIDCVPGPGVDQVVDLARGLPFPDAAFHSVLAVDILEHVDDIWGAADECLRVARYQCLIVLPNLYHWRHRLRYLLGREADKYRLPPAPIHDRHRWLPSAVTARAFYAGLATRHGVTARCWPVPPAWGPRACWVQGPLERIASENLTAWGVACSLTR